MQGTEELMDQILLSHNYLKVLSLEHKARCQLVVDIAQCIYDTESGMQISIASTSYYILPCASVHICRKRYY